MLILLAGFILETESRFGWATRLYTKHSSDMNPVKNKSPVSNLSVYFSL